MPTEILTAKMVKEAACPEGKPRLDLFDAQCKGLNLEIRATGGKTYYFRYRSNRGKPLQLKLADAKDITLAQARLLADKTRADIAMGNDPKAQKTELKEIMTFQEFATDHYLPFVATYKKSYWLDKGLLKNHIFPSIGSKYLDEISKNDIVGIHHGRINTGAAPGSANHLLILIRYIFNLAVRWETPGVVKNPSAGIPLFEENNKKERYLNQDEAQRLYAAVLKSDNPMLRHIVPMLILTGARKREVLDARWADFDIERHQWRIPVTKTGKARYVPISDGAIKLLASIPRINGCPWAFPNPKTGKPFVSIFYSWDSARKSAGLSDVRMHDLRHSFASFLVNAGRSIYEVQKILGHTQIKTTQRYAHLAQETLLDAANIVSQNVSLFGINQCVSDIHQQLAVGQ